MTLWVWKRRWFFAFVAAAFALLYPTLRDLTLNVEVTAAERGYQLAARSGCFTCHGADGLGGVKNPGSEDEEVPGFSGGSPMMWAKSEDELRQYILDGAPERKRNDPKYRETIKKWLLVMPSYRGYLSDAEVSDLVVYIRAVSALLVPEEELAAKGHELAHKLGCFQCHGPMGARGPSNPGSFKGYIPGWWGEDFKDLVRDDDELRAWIRDGQIQRLRDHPIAHRFIDAQRVSMPAYRDFLSEADLAAIMRYVRWVNEGNWDKELDLGH
jgi:mono/diheme cytochrome c family protein